MKIAEAVFSGLQPLFSVFGLRIAVTSKKNSVIILEPEDVALKIGKDANPTAIMSDEDTECAVTNNYLMGFLIYIISSKDAELATETIMRLYDRSLESVDQKTD